MKTTVQARLDEETQTTLNRVARQLGWSASKVVREGIHLVEQRHAAPKVRKLIGIGMYGGGPSDLSTNKKYLEDFGLKSMGRAEKAKARKNAK
jgi:hypothetical protein